MSTPKEGSADSDTCTCPSTGKGDESTSYELVNSVDELAKAVRALVARSPVLAEELLTADQVGDLFHMSPRTLRDLAACGQIPHRRIGKHYRFSRDDIAAIIQFAEQAQRSASPRAGMTRKGGLSWRTAS
ncbi:helix-turn-helix domain-containing protein [Actinokineospora cianjurensis]|uniref:helix-turn-helix domain-containing protein n=1 Tax=Actinokineospora cianjurensis TaxID=585224 RepID=UPI000EADF16A|nr:helix-turn-helix domain-containing protein [Actinokineospora cianjurensis]